MENQENYLKKEKDFSDIFEDFYLLISSNIKMIIISSFSIFFLSLIYLLITTKTYTTKTKIKILSQEETSSSFLQEINPINTYFYENSKNIEDEIEILKSKNILDKVIKDLNLKSSFYEKKILRNKKISHKEKFLIIESNNLLSLDLLLDFSDLNNIYISNIKTNVSKKIYFDKILVLGKDTLIIKKTKLYQPKSLKGKRYSVKINSAFNQFVTLKEKIQITSLTDNILNISIKGKDTSLNKKILVSILNTYNKDRIEDNKIITATSSSFLSKRIEIIKSDITFLENTLSDIKKDDNIFNVDAVNSIFSNQIANSQEMIFQIETQEVLVNSFINELNNNNNKDLLPIPIEVGITNTELSNFTSEFNNLIIDKNNLLKGRTSDNQEVKSLNSQILDLRNNLKISINNYLNKLKIKKDQVDKYDKDLELKFYKLNETELNILKIKREIEVKASILLFLLEKKEENDIQLAISSPVFKSLDLPNTDYSKGKPNNIVITVLAFIMSIFFPIFFLQFKKLINNKIQDIDELRTYLDNNISIVGEIPFEEKNQNNEEKRNPIIESFNLLRSSCEFLIDYQKKQAKVIGITSSIQSEGKTYTALNIAKSYSKIGAKTLLIGFDLRNPQLHKHLAIEKEKNYGITNYLLGKIEDINSIIISDNKDNFDTILSGPVPPNANKLLMSNKIEKMISYFKEKYDYIIIDTAPTLLVSDTYNIFKFFDLTLYVSRQNVTKKHLIEHVNKLYRSKLNLNLCVVLNGVIKKGNLYNYNYGYNYGYN